VKKRIASHPIYKYDKFQHDCAIFDFSKVLEVKRSQGPKNEDFEEKNHLQVFIQSTSVPNFNLIVPFLNSPGFLELLTQNCNKQTQ